MLIAKHLIDKYNQAIPRYTSYPPANFFHQQFTEADFRESLEQSNTEGESNISLYVHIPFCAHKCFYCGCNTHITRDQELVSSYLHALKKEIRLMADLVDRQTRSVSQIHWGGGTPNFLTAEQIADIMELIHSLYTFIPEPEVAIECNPAYLDYQYIDKLIDLGFNRFSLGVQDFSHEVLNAVKREIPEIPVADLVNHIRRDGKATVNIDLIYGLPLQNVEQFSQTLDIALAIRPNRLVTFSYAHLPNINPNQKGLEKYPMPDAETKLHLLELAYNKITAAGYLAIGFDHFALPTDELGSAIEKHELHRNFQGYCTKRTTGQVLAFGASAISQLHTAYAQNTKNVTTYISSINSGNLPIERGYKLSIQDITVREVINEIMCNLRFSWDNISAKIGITTQQAKQQARNAPDELNNLEADSIIEQTDNGLVVTNTGRFFVRNIAACFDPLNRENKTYSKTV